MFLISEVPLNICNIVGQHPASALERPAGVLGFGLRVPGFGFRVSGFGFRVPQSTDKSTASLLLVSTP